MAQYNGVPKLQQLNHLKDNYGGKNENGGRKCVFSQSKEYKRRGSHPGPSGITIVAEPLEGFAHTALHSWTVEGRVTSWKVEGVDETA